MEETRIVFSGSGGQGVITASVILAEAAVVYEGRNAIQSQSYGPEARGGATRSDVIISDTDIHFPRVLQPNILLCLTPTAFNKYHTILRPGGVLITDPKFVEIHKELDVKRYELPMYDAVMEKIGKPVVFNICVLGALSGLLGLSGKQSLEKALENHVPHDFLGINRQALDIGLEIGRNTA